MAQGLSLLLRVKKGTGSAVSKSLAAGFTPPKKPLGPGGTQQTGPNILHYAWVVPLPAQVGQPTDEDSVLLTTVYDKDFATYIKELVIANPKFFNDAAPNLVGLDIPVPPGVATKENLPKFIRFVLDNDLNHGGADNPTFFQAYNYTVVYIEKHVPKPPPGPSKPRAA